MFLDVIKNGSYINFMNELRQILIILSLSEILQSRMCTLRDFVFL